MNTLMNLFEDTLKKYLEKPWLECPAGLLEIYEKKNLQKFLGTHLICLRKMETSTTPSRNSSFEKNLSKSCFISF